MLPLAIAPFEVLVLPINLDNEQVKAATDAIYGGLKSAGADVLLDDRDARAGVKFKDADLLGIPLRIVIGDKNLKDGKVEIKRRTDAQPTLIPTADAVAEVLRILRDMKRTGDYGVPKADWSKEGQPEHIPVFWITEVRFASGYEYQAFDVGCAYPLSVPLVIRGPVSHTSNRAESWQDLATK